MYWHLVKRCWRECSVKGHNLSQQLQSSCCLWLQISYGFRLSSVGQTMKCVPSDLYIKHWEHRIPCFIPCNYSVCYHMETANFSALFAHQLFIILCHHLILNKPLCKVEHFLTKLYVWASSFWWWFCVKVVAELYSECAEQHSLLWWILV